MKQWFRDTKIFIIFPIELLLSLHIEPEHLLSHCVLKLYGIGVKLNLAQLCKFPLYDEKRHNKLFFHLQKKSCLVLKTNNDSFIFSVSITERHYKDC